MTSGKGGSVGALYAHSRAVTGRRHLLADHLRETATLAHEFGQVFGAGEAAAYLALVHDVGKGCCAWQDGLLKWAEPHGQPVGVPHKDAGTQLAAQYVGLPFAAAVQGHHGGLPDQEKVKNVLLALRGTGPDAASAREAIDNVARLVPEILPAKRLDPVAWLRDLPDAGARRLGIDLLVRMLYSCLVDADFLDTAAHFAGTPPQVAATADMTALAARFEKRRSEYLAQRPASAVDQVRNRVYEEALAAAAGKPGMYVLHVPTGGAKTIAAGGFALQHAALHGLSRVVIAVPFISVTEQNAQVYRELLDTPRERVVLEHHSSVQLDDGSGAGRWARLAAENWDAPVVVTTTVQLFESLFAHRPSAMRKVHRLAGSVIVLDEVQALPDRLLVPILSVLRGLVEHFGASVVLSSATQPEFWALRQMEGLPRHGVVSDVRGLFEELSRVRYEWRLGDDVTWESIAAEIAVEGGDQVLTVVNTTTDAALLHRLLTEPHARSHSVGAAPGASEDNVVRPTIETPVWHLSTRMTAGHRREVINQVREDLRAGRPVHVISTTLIEAGVDVDFPKVYRAWAPAESLQQAAGRCNRDGHLPTKGLVVIFRPIDGRTPKDPTYRAALNATAAYFGPGKADPDDVDAIKQYYPKRYAHQGSDDRARGEHIQDQRRAWNFPAVANDFQMVDDDYTQPVIVIRPGTPAPHQDQIDADIALLRSLDPCGPEPLRRLQPHTAALPRHEVTQALSCGLAKVVIGDLVVWHGHYDPQRGLDPTAPEDRGAYQI